MSAPKISKEDFENRLAFEPSCGCWLWTGAVRCPPALPYGKIKRGNLMSNTHRIAWELYRGPIPDGLHVLHRCDVPQCCNPDHLFLGTQSDNNKDMFAKGRSYDRRGVFNPRSKLTLEQVAAIRADGRNQYIIAAEYGVGQSTISRIKRGEVYEP